MFPKSMEQLNTTLDEFYKVCIYNSQGVVSHVLLFIGGLDDYLPENEDEAIEKMIANIPHIGVGEIRPPQIIRVPMRIHFDDSIHVIKKKVLKAMINYIENGGDVEFIDGSTDTATLFPVYDELYLFAYTKEHYTLKQLYLSAIGNDSVSMSGKTMAHIFDKMGIVAGTGASAGSGVGINENGQYSYEDFERKVSESGQNIFMKTALGISIDNEHGKTAFEANPYNIGNGGNGGNGGNVMEVGGIQYLENRLLLNSNEIAHNTIYLCIARNVFKWISPVEFGASSTVEKPASASPSQESENVRLVCNQYFRHLYYKGIRNGMQLEQNMWKLAEDTRKMLDPKIFQIYSNVELLHKIHEQRKYDLKYEEKGIQYIQFRLRSSYKSLLPLDIVFRNIHASKMIPFIKYNPGHRRENVYRLYYQSLSKTGNKIPYLDPKTLMRLSRDMGRLRQISMYVVDEYSEVANTSIAVRTGDKGEHTENALQLTGTQIFYVNLEQSGAVSVQCQFQHSKSVNEINKMLGISLNKIIVQVNSFLRQTGFTISPFQTLDNPAVEIMDMKWSAKIIQNGTLKHKSFGCIRSIFDIENENLEKLKMNYTRVENYVEMSKENAYISKKYRSINDKDAIPDILFGLVSEFGITIEEAKMKMGEYLNTHGYISGMIVDNAGFTSSLSVIKDVYNMFDFQIQNITSIHYIKCIETYVDSIIRIIQDIKSTGVSREEIENACKISKSVMDKVKKEENNISAMTNIALVGDVDNVGVDIGDDSDVLLAEGNVGVDHDMEDDDILSFVDDYEYEEMEEPCMVDGEGECQDIYGDGYFEDGDGIRDTDVDADAGIPLEKQERGLFMDSESSGNGEDKINMTNDANMFGKENEEYEEDDDYFLFEGGGGGRNGNMDAGDDEEEGFQANPAGMSLHPSPFLKRMMKRDPALFKTTGKNNDSEYTRKCQPIGRYPVVLTREEKERIDRESPNSYSVAMEYGTDDAHKHFYICPRFWCLKTGKSMTEEEVKEGKCGGIIPDKVDGNKVPEGHYVYEFKRKNPYDKNGNYVQHRPGLFTIDGRKYALPCCYKSGNVEERTLKESAKTESIARGKYGDDAREVVAEIDGVGVQKMGEGRQSQYIIKMETIPVDKDRWGYLPIVAQLFLNMNYSKAIDRNNPSFIIPNTPVLLRYGIEKSENQSFIGLLAELYAYKQGLKRTPTIEQMKNILVKIITLDIFARIHNASFITSFFNENGALLDISAILEKYGETELVKKINVDNKRQVVFIKTTVNAYENFVNYLKNSVVEIDHSYLWSFIVSSIPELIPDGMNMVLLNRVENDITPHIGLICPTILSSKQLYDPKKETVVVLKQGNYYEPVYLYEIVGGKTQVKKSFHHRMMNENILSILENVKNITNKYCSPLPSMPRVYEFSIPTKLDEILSETYKIGYSLVKQVQNFQGKIIGVVLAPPNVPDTKRQTIAPSTPDRNIFVPCYPTTPLTAGASFGNKQPADIVFMDSTDIWKDYVTTRDMLMKISNDTDRKVKCAIRLKVVDDGLVVGFITQTNQFVQILPFVENIFDDGIPEYVNHNFNEVDMTVATELGEDSARIERIKLVELETNFFYCFKTVLRDLLNDYKNRGVKKEIMELIVDKEVGSSANVVGIADASIYKQKSIVYRDVNTYSNKIKKIEALLRKIGGGKIKFMEIENDVIDELGNLLVRGGDDGGDDGGEFCMKINIGGDGVSVFPKWHLFNLEQTNNETLYYARIADDILRNERGRLYLLDNNKYLNIKNLDYKVNADEFIIIQSALTTEYLNSLEQSFVKNDYLKHINYDNAYPAITQKYDDIVNLDDQFMAKQMVQRELMYKIRDVIGNDRIIWKRIFPRTSKEYIFNNDIKGAYNAIGFIIGDLLKQYKDGRMGGAPAPRMDVLAGLVGEYEQDGEINMYGIKKILWNGYAELSNYWDKIHFVLFKQGKIQLMNSVVNGRQSFESLVYSADYYLSDMDIWVIAYTYNLPIVMFNPNGLKGFGNNKFTWIKMGGIPRDKYYFMRSLLDSSPNKISAYNLIYPSIEISKLGEFDAIMRNAYIANSEYSANILPLDEWLETDIAMQ